MIVTVRVEDQREFLSSGTLFTLIKASFDSRFFIQSHSRMASNVAQNGVEHVRVLWPFLSL